MKKTLIFVFVLVCTILLADGVAPVGDGTRENPYQIATLDNLLWFNDFDFSVANPNSQYGRYFFAQTADIDADDTRNWNDGKGFNPLGYRENSQFQTYYYIDYNGLSHSISNLHINRPEEDWIGFIRVGRSKNFSLTNCYIIGKDYVGGISGKNPYDSFENCSVSGIIKGRNRVGGLVGEMCFADIINCNTSGIVEGEQSVGGISGVSYGDYYEEASYPNRIKNSYSTCYVKGSLGIKGISGGTEVRIEDCYFSGRIECETDYFNVLGHPLLFNSHYNLNQVLVNNEPFADVGALPEDIYEDWLNNDMVMPEINIENYLRQQTNGTLLIDNIEDLYMLSIEGANTNHNFKLTSDLDFSSNLNFTIKEFNGNFDGNNFKIKNFSGEQSFFEKISHGGIKNLHIEGKSNENSNFVPFIEAIHSSDIENCSITFNMNELVQTNNPFIHFAYNSSMKKVKVKGNFEAYTHVWRSVCPYGYVHSSFFGGICKSVQGSILNECVFYGKIKIKKQPYYGAENDSCYEVGGTIVASSVNSTIKNCYSRPFLPISTTRTYDRKVGKLIGTMEDSNLINSYSATACLDSVLVGELRGDNNTIQNSFWLCDEPENADENSLTTAEMQNINTFTNAGWDFAGETENGTDDIWTYDGNSDYNFPVLSWESLPLVDEKDEFNAVPEQNSLKLSNYPNPFNPSTQICFEIPKNQTANLSIYNVKGQLIKSYNNLKYNQKSVTWLGKNNQNQSVASGVYFYKLKTKNKAVTNKMLLMK